MQFITVAVTRIKRMVLTGLAWVLWYVIEVLELFL